jgi:hypothetical protein
MNTSAAAIAAALLFAVPLMPGSAPAGFIVPTFTGPFTAQEQACLEEAIKRWEQKLASVNGLAITFICDDFMSPANGKTLIDSFYSDHQKQPKSATITVNNSRLWWDPTPGTDEGDIPLDKRDGLSTAMHEICHALGFTQTQNPGGGFDANIVDSPSMGKIWTDGELIEDLDDTHPSHTVAAGLMYWFGAPGVRDVITDKFPYMLTRSHDCYSIVPEPTVLPILSAGTLFLLRLRREGAASRRDAQVEFTPVSRTTR